ncbi:AAA family ATPase [Sporolactobacillus sp. THM19-2]|uniref:ATP-binding protein n=1 Tax=Sporolactobacillus sp. THM19-2 TaxID=2511171 RepID=UPI0010214EB6|nr:AAA family ATPase [Sporolactobacillus sp. THM19-2]RYL94499.1 hypothetical protein EWH91_00485 [Sporolactobacillus sp. THM19-2]
MKIKSLEIDRFGRFERQKIHLTGQALTVVYGENESGKSTIMQFLLAILFGFPQKNAMSRWMDEGDENLTGGTVLFTSDDGRLCRLKRTYTDNGRPQLLIGDQKADLGKWLTGVDRLLYQNVFCFDLTGLQGIEKKRPSDLNDLLLGAGMTGTQVLTELEQQLAKKCGELFKKGGKNPDLNRLFRELDATGAKIGKWEQKLSDFLELEERIRQLKETIKKCETEKKEVQTRYRDWTAFTAIRPLIIRARAIDAEIRKLGPVRPFPEDGKARYEDIRRQKDTLEREVSEREEQIRETGDQIGALSVRTDWLAEEGRLTTLFRSAVRDEQNMGEVRRLHEELAEKKSAYRQHVRRLGPDWDDSRVASADVSLSFLKTFKEKSELWKKAAEEKRRADDIRENQSEAVRQLTDQVKIVQQQRASASGGDRADRRGGRQAKISRFTYLAGATVLVLLSVLVSVLITPSAGVLFFAFGLVPGIVVVMGRRFSEGRSESRESAGPDDAEFRFRMKQLADAERLDKAKQQAAEEAGHGRDQRERELIAWLNDRGYKGIAPDFAEEAVRLEGEARILLDKIRTLEKRITERLGEHRLFESEKSDLTGRLGLPEGDITFLEQILDREKKKGSRIDELKRNRMLYVKQKERLLSKLEKLTAAAHDLFEKAGAESEEQFLQAAEKHVHHRELQKEKEKKHLDMIETAGSEEQLRIYIDALDSGKWADTSEESFRDQTEEIDSRLKKARADLIAGQAERQSLVADDTYRDTLDHYEALRTEAGEKARKWASLRMAQWAIRKAKDLYRKERLPGVLDQAGRYFNYITSGKYKALRLEDSDGFIAVQDDGSPVRAEQLSRGAAEQLYLSLRFALTDAFSGRETLPLIIDEGFAEFDALRTRRVYHLIEKMAQKRQVILFTCHQSAFLHDHPEYVISLSKEVPTI